MAGGLVRRLQLVEVLQRLGPLLRRLLRRLREERSQRTAAELQTVKRLIDTVVGPLYRTLLEKSFQFWIGRLQNVQRLIDTVVGPL